MRDDGVARSSGKAERAWPGRDLLALVLIAAGAGACSDANGWHSQAQAPASITDDSRDAPKINDFLRILFVPSGVVPSALGLPSALRVFATASAFFEPALPAAETADYPGLAYRDDRDLVALRCSPPDPTRLDPVLASWPLALRAIQGDLSGRYTCPPADGSPENEVFCIAGELVDTPDATVAAAVLRALQVGVQLFATPGRAAVVQQRFGMYPAFSGLGFAVKGTGDGAPVTAERALRQSIVPEYLLRNASLADAGCYCVIVPPYADRATAPLDPGFVVQKGGYGECRTAERLERVSS
jgi:hypothetical protein